ncbi:MAG: Gfo/Idh/MocA family oxidoreductase [Planctomycetota bacterium]
MTPEPTSLSTRRTFLKTSAAAATLLATRRIAHAGASDRLKVGLIGCGGRGTGAAANCVESSPGVEIHAMGDLFPDRLASSRKNLGFLEDALTVDDSRCFTGFDAFKGVLSTDVDLIILATPPQFRPQHLAAAIEAGKNVFMEKPVAVDPVGIRSVIESAKAAKQKNLAIVAGTQRRHEDPYLETMKRIHDGAIGDIVGGDCHWNQGGLWVKTREQGWSDMEWQLRNWLYFTWASGDHIVEQHVHNLDVMNWALGSTPLRAIGMGGRQVRTGEEYGHIFDHFSIEYEYPGGVWITSTCRQIDGCASGVWEGLMGTKGKADPAGSITSSAGDWRFDKKSLNPYVQEHRDLIQSIRDGEPLNEGRRIAESTLTAIMGRMSTYTGKEVTWDFALNSKLDLTPPHYEFGPLPVTEVAIPGTTELI